MRLIWGRLAGLLILTLTLLVAWLVITGGRVAAGRSGHSSPSAGSQSGIAASLTRQPVAPDELIRLIVELEGEPVLARRERLAPAASLLTAADAEALRAYASTLAARQEALIAAARQAGVALTVHDRFTRLLNGLAVTLRRRDVAVLQRLPGVSRVSPDTPIYASLTESVPLIGAPQVWQMHDAQDRPVTGQGIRVAVIDSGIDYTHPDLGGCLGADCRVIGGYDFIGRDQDPWDDNGHGTHVAGIIAANGQARGVAPQARLLAYKVLNARGSGWGGYVIAALDKAADPDGDPATPDAVDVVNLSLGGSTAGSPTDPQARAVDAAVEAGIVVVVSTGNNGPARGSVTTPGTARQAITVGDTDKSDALDEASSRGPDEQFVMLKPDILAPGMEIVSTVPEDGANGDPSRYLSLSGSSMAAPHVAGGAALLRQLHPDWSPARIKANLMNTAKVLDLLVFDQGAGRVQLAQAASAPLVAEPASLFFGFPLVDNTQQARLLVTNVTTAPVTATVAVSCSLQLTEMIGLPPSPVSCQSYVQPDRVEMMLSSGDQASLTVTLQIPSTAAEGYYGGYLSFQTDQGAIQMPFAFALLSRLTVHVRDASGQDMEQPALSSTGYNNAVIFRVPDLGVSRGKSDLACTPCTGLPAHFVIPAGTYHAYAGVNLMGMIWPILLGEAEPTVPYLLSGVAVVPKGSQIHLYLQANDARLLTLNATSYADLPVFPGRTDAWFRYEWEGKEYVVNMPLADSRHDPQFSEQGPIFSQLPKSYRLYVSATPPHVSFSLANVGFAYSPALLRFRELNATRWYDGYGVEPGLSAWADADEVYLFSWRFPAIGPTTTLAGSVEPTITLHYPPDQVSRYQWRSDLPGPVAQATWGSPILPGDLGIFPLSPAVLLDRGYSDSVFPSWAGLNRTLYVQGLAGMAYTPDRAAGQFPGLAASECFGRPDWTRWLTSSFYANVFFPQIADLQFEPVQTGRIDLGTGPAYPALRFDNTATAIRLFYPLLAGRGSETWSSFDRNLWLYHNGLEVYTIPLYESIDEVTCKRPLRVIPVNQEGEYRLELRARSTPGKIASESTVWAGLTLPGNDPNPPQITRFQMEQRFAAGQPLPVTFTAIDPESGIASVVMHYSLDNGATWLPATVIHQDDHYTATIATGEAIQVSLWYTLTDHSGNYLAFSTVPAAVRETPVTLSLTVAPSRIPLTAEPVTMTLAGSLRGADALPLSQAGVLMAIELNHQLAGYVSDVVFSPEEGYATGVIQFDWSFVPTDLITQPGTVPLRVVFDLGTYARQEVTHWLDFEVTPTPTSTTTPTPTAAPCPTPHRLYLPVLAQCFAGW